MASSIAALLAAAIFAVTLVRGSTTAGGTDSSGYLSEGAAIARGRLTKDVPLARQLSWPDAEATLAPVGWKPSGQSARIAPTYPPGYPLTLAIARTVAGERAMFLVVPALAALAAWCTFAIGRRLDSPATGVAAALLLASSPPFVFQTLQPMSDVPATAWWLAAMVLASHTSAGRALGAGSCAALGLLTRPNLAPIGAAIGVYLALRLWSAPREERRIGPLLLFLSPLTGAALALVAVQNYLYGSPLMTGYGSPSTLFAVENASTNLQRYSGWLFEDETTLVLIGLVAPLVLLRRRDAAADDTERMRLMLLGLAVILIVFASYLFYTPFDNWTYLRFLLPAYPALFVLTIMSVRRAGQSLGAWGSLALVAIVCAVMVDEHVQRIGEKNIMTVAQSERRYERLARYLGTRVLGRVAFIGMQHTGSVSYYAERTIIRWDWLGEHRLDEAIAELEQRGYRPMILLEEYEEKDFKARFADEVYGRVDWLPRVASVVPPVTRLYDPADRARYLAGERWAVEEVR